MHATETTSHAEREFHNGAEQADGGARARILVLLAAYNGSDWIGPQIESILEQRGVDVRLAVRDDGSTDGTPAELARLARDSRVSLIPCAAATGSAAQNFLTLIRENAAEEADFVAFADQDDLWDRDKLLRACRTVAAEASAGYSSATLAVWEDGRQRLLRPSGAATSCDFLFEGAGQGCTFVLSADFYSRVRRFLTSRAELTRELHYHDWAIYALARAWGLPWSFDPRPSLKYRQHDRNDTGARGTAGGLKRRLLLIRRGWYGAQLRTIAELCSAAAGSNATIRAWRSMLFRPDGLRRRLQIAGFALRGGRRRMRDRAMLATAALAGWI